VTRGSRSHSMSPAGTRVPADHLSIKENLMTQHAEAAGATWSPATAGLREAAREITGRWWLGLVAGIGWLVVALVLLQFDHASVTTVGVLVGIMFTVVATQTVAAATIATGAMRWSSVAFAVLFAVAAVLCFADPQATFAGLADMLGFLFLIVGIWWMIRAFLERPLNPTWWTGLISGVLMTGMAFWTAGQFFITKAYVLLVFAGIWALMQGIGDITRAFAVRRLNQEL
jgi:uncharacterized membrane protein HdeD (DUF308 family)